MCNCVEPIQTVTTDENGTYEFRGVAEGSYSIQAVVPAGRKVVLANQGSRSSFDSNADANGMISDVSFDAQRSNRDLDIGLVAAGFLPAGKVGGSFWADKNGDGIR